MDTTFNKLREKFNQNALQYDNQRRKLIPCFDDFIPFQYLLLRQRRNHQEF
ncbi:hypothetical protein [Bacillus sp. B1-b2]|uniref:hypothetical protein n=1 Tax=Bacillus sp. B1-b2 TaxID=2653201 RepID=UPI001D02A07C|nr:hypothetical protein [Bacillus sp. B1-b2]